MTAKNIAPGIRQLLPLPIGPLRRALRDPLAFYAEAFRTYGDIIRLRFGPVVVHLLRHPDHIKHVLQDNWRNYPRSREYKSLALVLGDGLVTTDGDQWLQQRRMCQPCFQRQRLAGMAATMTAAAGDLLARWRRLTAAERTLDLNAEMMRLTLDIAGRTLFSSDVSSHAQQLGASLTQAIQIIDHRINSPIKLPLFLPTPSHRRLWRAVAALDRIVYEIIDERQKAPPEDAGDLLSFLLAARDEETGAAMTRKELRDQVMTFILAGHETTAVALSWTWYLLSQHPEIDARMRAEVDQVLAGRPPALNDLPRLKYTRMVLEESMRLYPPVWGVSRDVAADDEIGGFHVPRGSMIAITQFMTHRHPDFWDDPEKFDPDRFTPALAAARPRYAYFPFLGGPHQCIGNEFALMEGVLVLAMIVQAFRISHDPEHRVEMLPTITLRPKYGMRMRLEPVRSGMAAAGIMA